MEAKKYTIDDLCELSGYSRRTIRYYVQEGLLEPPSGRGRGGFYYDSHLQILLRIKSLQESGMKLKDITVYLKHPQASNAVKVKYSREVWVKYEVVPDMEINVTRSLEESQGKNISEIIKIARSVLREDNKHEQ